jgi:hypothetical protein
MSPRPTATVWLPLLVIALGVVVAVNVNVVVGMWTLAAFALGGAVIRATGWFGGGLRIRRRVVDTTFLVLIAAAITFVATSGVLD